MWRRLDWDVSCVQKACGRSHAPIRHHLQKRRQSSRLPYLLTLPAPHLLSAVQIQRPGGSRACSSVPGSPNETSSSLCRLGGREAGRVTSAACCGSCSKVGVKPQVYSAAQAKRDMRRARQRCEAIWLSCSGAERAGDRNQSRRADRSVAVAVPAIRRPLALGWCSPVCTFSAAGPTARYRGGKAWRQPQRRPGNRCACAAKAGRAEAQWSKSKATGVWPAGGGGHAPGAAGGSIQQLSQLATLPASIARLCCASIFCTSAGLSAEVLCA